MWRELGLQFYEYFDSIAVKWTRIDPVCFAEVGKKAGPPFLWVGMMPGALSRYDAEVAAVGCKDILAQSQRWLEKDMMIVLLARDLSTASCHLVSESPPPRLCQSQL